MRNSSISLLLVYFDFAMINLVRPTVAYACFSVFAYLVNGRLSIRNLKLKHEGIVNDLSLVIWSRHFSMGNTILLDLF